MSNRRPSSFAVSLSEVTWESHVDQAGKTYYRSSAAPAEKPWQLFVNGEPLTLAKYPNVPMWSEQMWSRDEGYAKVEEGTHCGHTIDAGPLAVGALGRHVSE